MRGGGGLVILRNHAGSEIPTSFMANMELRVNEGNAPNMQQ